MLTPLRFLERSARVWKDRPAVVSGKRPGPTRSTTSACAAPPRSCATSSASGRATALAVLLPNAAAMLELTYAVPGVRGVLVPLNTAPGRPRVRVHPRALRREGARRRQQLHEETPSRSSATTPAGRVDVDEYEELLDAADPVDALERPDDERALISINYTSGTTGKPKGVMTNHRGAYLHALGVIAEAGSPRAAPTCGRCRCSTATAGRIRGR